MAMRIISIPRTRSGEICRVDVEGVEGVEKEVSCVAGGRRGVASVAGRAGNDD
jgi:hypothetical protein